MKKIILACGAAAAALSLSACATVTRGSSQKYSIDTTPTAANVSLSTGQTCVSPCNLKLKRKTGFIVKANKKGYQEASAVVDSRIRGGGIAGGAGNILAGGLIGVAVDASSGAMNDLTPNPLHLTLKPVEAAPVAEAAPAVTTVAPAAAVVPAPAADATAAPAASTEAPADEAATSTPGGE